MNARVESYVFVRDLALKNLLKFVKNFKVKPLFSQPLRNNSVVETWRIRRVCNSTC